MNRKTRPATPRRRRQPRQQGWTIGAALLAVILLFVCAGFAWSRITEKPQTFTVTRVLDQPVSNTSCHHNHCTTRISHKYLVFTDQGTYQDSDSIWFFKFSSSDLIGELQDGHTYRCDTTGFRLGYTSSYRNLISCTEVHHLADA